MSANELAVYAGIVLSLLLAYAPKLREWYDAKSGAEKAQIMGGLLVAVALGVFGLSCAKVYLLVECSAQGAQELFGYLVAALIANQSTFMIGVKPFKKAASN